MFINLISMDGLKIIYNSFLSDKRKERFEMILEPLQGMVQLAMLSYCPLGSKLSISNNILIIQEPTWTQSLSRSYNKDGRDDLVYIFNVITRFYKFYSVLKNSENDLLFKLLIDLAKKGLDVLIQTYSNSGHGSLIQSLRMYKSMLENTDILHLQKNIEDKKEDIDGIFINIRDLYNQIHYTIIYNLLLLMKQDTDNYVSYMKSINNTYKPLSNNIQKWIHEHIAF